MGTGRGRSDRGSTMARERPGSAVRRAEVGRQSRRPARCPRPPADDVLARRGTRSRARGFRSVTLTCPGNPGRADMRPSATICTSSAPRSAGQPQRSPASRTGPWSRTPAAIWRPMLPVLYPACLAGSLIGMMSPGLGAGTGQVEVLAAQHVHDAEGLGGRGVVHRVAGHVPDTTSWSSLPPLARPGSTRMVRDPTVVLVASDHGERPSFVSRSQPSTSGALTLAVCRQARYMIRTQVQSEPVRPPVPSLACSRACSGLAHPDSEAEGAK